jgi:hypothetical protein
MDERAFELELHHRRIREAYELRLHAVRRVLRALRRRLAGE